MSKDWRESLLNQEVTFEALVIEKRNGYWLLQDIFIIYPNGERVYFRDHTWVKSRKIKGAGWIMGTAKVNKYVKKKKHILSNLTMRVPTKDYGLENVKLSN